MNFAAIFGRYLIGKSIMLHSSARGPVTIRSLQELHVFGNSRNTPDIEYINGSENHKKYGFVELVSYVEEHGAQAESLGETISHPSWLVV